MLKRAQPGAECTDVAAPASSRAAAGLAEVEDFPTVGVLCSLASVDDLRAELNDSFEYAHDERRALAVLWLRLQGRDGAALDLHACAERLLACAHDGDVLAYAGGAEFAVLRDSVGRTPDPAEAARETLNAFRRPLLTEAGASGVAVAVGVAIYPGDGRDPAQLLAAARAAASRATATGAQLAFADPGLDDRSRRDRQIQDDLERALERGELELHYQPVVDAGGRARAMEALIRWRHPQRGMAFPIEFVPVAERTGQIVPIGERVIVAACQQAARWEGAGMDLRVAVNLSVRQFSSPRLVECIARALRSSGLNPELLELELTESLFAQPESTAEILNRMHLLGVKVAIDDFGTGFSSLSYLTRLPIDTIKIDRSFVSHAPEDDDAAAVVSAVLAMAQQLKLETVAEGVETDEQAQFLRARGCDLFQGFLYGRPLSPARCDAWLRAHFADQPPKRQARPRAAAMG